MTAERVKLSKNGRKKVHITTLGCSKNVYDSEILMGQLQANQVPLSDSPEDADVIIINTCGFITPAKQESIQAILEATELKEQNKDMQVIVCGCLSARYQKDLSREIPQVDAYFGTEDYQGILKYLNLPLKNNVHLYEDRLVSTKPHYAYLKISEGCNHKCAFCAIPLMRGRHRSRSMEDIVKEARILSLQGVKELILIAQDTTFYGLDLYRSQKIIDLLLQLQKIESIEWIRLHYAYPTTFQDDLITLIAESPKIVHYVDLPLQHITDHMLKIMKRGGTARRIKQILNNLRERIPDIAIRTTFIVGHPGETEKDFEELKNHISEFRFNRLGAFIYSPEENTAASALKPPAKEIAERRYQELLEIQQKISLQNNENLVGKVVKVLVDEYDPENQSAVGRTYADSPEIDNEVIIENISQIINTGKFYDILINAAAEYELFGEIVEDQ
ncbi:MAG: 30S ribosomal protein S12 methylthiotransferase RimO [bacterium]|nr:MAG: 30S ribosomal protein S12 methylthiotransferase RimO [bacterium]